MQGTNLEGVRRETTIHGGVRCDFIYPYTHQYESELFVLSFAIENKKYIYRKKIVRVSLLLITLFSMLEIVCLGYVQREKFERINQREERHR